MINYILGGLIIGIVVLIVINSFRNVKSGKCSCGHDCSGEKSDCCSKDHK